MNRFFYRLFRWRTLRRVLIVLAGLITLAALLWTEERLRGKYEWEKYKRQLETKGERLDFASFAPAPVPDASNFFMAPIWAAALNQPWINPYTGKVESLQTNVGDRIRMDPFGPTDVAIPKGGGGWRKGSLTDVKAWQDYYRRVAAVTNFFPVPTQPGLPAHDLLMALSRYDSTTEELRKAGERPGARLPLDYNNPPLMINRLLPILADVKAPAQVLVMRSKAEFFANNSAAALSDVKLLLRLTDSIRNQPVFIAHLVRTSLMTITLEPIYEGLALHQWTDEQLTEIQTRLGNEDFLADFEFAMRADRAFGLLFSSLPQYYHLNPFCYQQQLALSRMFQQWILPCVNTNTRVVSPEQVRQLLESEATEWKHTTPYNVMAKAEFPALNKAVIKFAAAQVGVDEARVACALERYHLAHGEYPESLDALSPQFIAKLPHDIINGQPLHYRRTDDGRFILYSVGWNETDDGGIRGKRVGWDTQQGDWVWEYPAQ